MARNQATDIRETLTTAKAAAAAAVSPKPQTLNKWADVESFEAARTNRPLACPADAIAVPLHGGATTNDQVVGAEQTCPQIPKTVPEIGMSRWAQLRHFIPVSRETWRKLVLAGKAPQPIRLSERCTMYSNSEVHRWLSAPTDFRVEG